MFMPAMGLFFSLSEEILVFGYPYLAEGSWDLVNRVIYKANILTKACQPSSRLWAGSPKPQNESTSQRIAPGDEARGQVEGFMKAPLFRV